MYMFCDICLVLHSKDYGLGMAARWDHQREKLQAKHKAAIPQDQSVDLSRHARKPPSAALCVQTLGCAGKGRFELREDTHLVGQMVPWKGVAMAQSCPSKTCAS